MWTSGTDDSKRSFLLNPTQVKVGPDNNVFVLDRGDYSIKTFAPEGGFVRSIAGKRGRGPGEIMNPTDFDIDNEGRIWIADPPSGRLSVYGPEGDFSYDVELEHRPQRLAVHEEGSTFYTTWLSPTKDALFGQYDGSGRLQRHFGRIVENQPRRGIALDGWIAVTPDQSLYYTTTRAGRLMGFNAQGKKVLNTKTVDYSPIPEVIVDERGGRRVDPSASISSLGLQVVNGKILVLSVIPDDREVSTNRAFDVYNTKGEYKHSIPLPNGTSRAHFTPNRIYTLTDTSLVAWESP